MREPTNRWILAAAALLSVLSAAPAFGGCEGNCLPYWDGQQYCYECTTVQYWTGMICFQAGPCHCVMEQCVATVPTLPEGGLDLVPPGTTEPPATCSGSPTVAPPPALFPLGV